jgi:hypothetical protein
LRRGIGLRERSDRRQRQKRQDWNDSMGRHGLRHSQCFLAFPGF